MDEQNDKIIQNSIARGQRPKLQDGTDLKHFESQYDHPGTDKDEDVSKYLHVGLGPYAALHKNNRTMPSLVVHMDGCDLDNCSCHNDIYQYYRDGPYVCRGCRRTPCWCGHESFSMKTDVWDKLNNRWTNMSAKFPWLSKITGGWRSKGPAESLVIDNPIAAEIARQQAMDRFDNPIAAMIAQQKANERFTDPRLAIRSRFTPYYEQMVDNNPIAAEIARQQAREHLSIDNPIAAEIARQQANERFTDPRLAIRSRFTPYYEQMSPFSLVPKPQGLVKAYSQGGFTGAWSYLTG